MRALLEVGTVVEDVQKTEGPRAGCYDCPRTRPECRRCPVYEAEQRKVHGRFSRDVVAAAETALRAHQRFPPPRRRPGYWTPAFAILVGYAGLEAAIYERSKALGAPKG